MIHVAAAPERNRQRSAFCARLAVAWLLLAGTAYAEDESWTVTTQRNLFRGGDLSIAQVRTPEVQAVVRCESEVRWVEARFFVAPELVTGTGTMRWQFDGARPASGTWARSPNRKSVIVAPTDQSAFIRQLQRSTSLTLLMTDAAGAEQSIRVPLRGSSAAITEALRHCRN